MSRFDPGQARPRFSGAAAASGPGRALAREVEQRMAERLDYVRIFPARVLDAGCGSGEGLRLLARRYPRAAVFGIDAAHALARQAARPRGLAEWMRSMFVITRASCICGEMAQLPLQTSSVDLVWSNLALDKPGDAGTVFREFHRVLVPGGLLMFSTFGADSLKELRESFPHVSRLSALRDFPDLRELGDLLVASAFSDPVIDVDRITFADAAVGELIGELPQIEQVIPGNDRLRRIDAPDDRGPGFGAEGIDVRHARVSATFRIIFGHAWKAHPRAPAERYRVVPIQLRGAGSA